VSSAQISSIMDELVDVIETERGTVAGFIQNRNDTPRLASMRRLDVSYMLEPNRDEFIFGLYDTTPTVIWPINVGVAVKSDDGLWKFSEAKSIPPKEARGRARIISPKMLMLRHVMLYPDGRVIGASEFLSHINSMWIDATQNGFSRKHDVAG
jgi:hypothetical protein